MFEIDNQVEEKELVFDDFILPDDYEEEDTEEDEVLDLEYESEEEIEESDEQEETEKIEEEEKPISLEEETVKFLHEQKALKDIPRDELKTFIQKGMNHDRIQEKLNDAIEQRTEIEEVAQMFDMDINQMLEALKQQYFNKIAEEKGKDPEDVKYRYNNDRKSRQDKMFEQFIDKYPDVNTKELPSEVLESIKEGENIIKAYEKYLDNQKSVKKDNTIKEQQTKIEELEKKLKVYEQNKVAKKKGVVKSTKGNDINNDPFLEGLFG